MHPSARLRASKSRLLQGRRIVLGVCGSIAAVEAVRVAHELIRHGADVLPVLTPSAASFVGPMALEYATGHAPLIHLSGAGEHVAWMDGPGRADLLLIAPATANTIAKVALGIDDTALTSLASVALGSGMPILVAPAMHEVMGRNAALLRRLKELQAAGVTLVEPQMSESKAKLATPEALAEACIHRLAAGPWAGRRVLVINGASAEPIDPVRVLTNRTSGRMGHAVATAAHRAGADVKLWQGWTHEPAPPHLAVERFERVRDLLRWCTSARLSRYDAIFVPAALADFAPVPQIHKISSETAPQVVRVKLLPKVVAALRRAAPKSVLVGWKAESDERRLVARADARRKQHRLDLVVANTTRAFGADTVDVFLVDGSAKPRRMSGPKSAVAEVILAAAAKRLSR